MGFGVGLKVGRVRGAREVADVGRVEGVRRGREAAIRRIKVLQRCEGLFHPPRGSLPSTVRLCSMHGEVLFDAL